MIITRSPLRVSLGGGGTDLPSYYKEHEGFLISAAIDKYTYITLHRPFTEEIHLKYSKMERVSAVDDIQHPIIREALRLAAMPNPYFEIDSIADVPAGTGLGSSGSFTCALLAALHAYKKDSVSPRELAEEACHIEIDLLHEPIGKQDQYIAAYGGLNTFTFCKNGDVRVEPLKVTDETLYCLEENLLLFFTGFSRSASAVLKEQDDKSKQNDQSMLDNLHFVKDLGRKSQIALESGDLDAFAELMNVHWTYKKQRSASMSNGKIDDWYEIALKNGAKGGKIVGAGGGGMLMFYADNSVKLRRAMAKEGLREIHFKFDPEGTKVVTRS